MRNRQLLTSCTVFCFLEQWISGNKRSRAPGRCYFKRFRLGGKQSWEMFALVLRL